MSGFAQPRAGRDALRALGVGLALFSVVGPALPLGWLMQQPPMPLAVLWLAYGWATEDSAGLRAPILLALIGLLHDVLAGGPIGLFMAIYIVAYLVGRGSAVAMSAPNLFSLWGGFIVTSFLIVLVAAMLGPWAAGARMSVRPFAEAAAITALLFPLVRPLYMDAVRGPRAQSGYGP